MSFYVERERGNDWCVKDSKGVIKASGLDLEEAEVTCNLWNTDTLKEKQNFVESP